MLTRLYIDNYRCFVNFEYRPGRKQLIFGRNGTGKSSFMDALLDVRRFVVGGHDAAKCFSKYNLTRWHNRREQTFEIEAEVDGRGYVYRLVIDRWGEPIEPRVLSETVKCDGRPIFEFVSGDVHLYNDRFEHKVTYSLNQSRSALDAQAPSKENLLLMAFKRWLGGLLCFRLNPFAMRIEAPGEDLYPNVDLSNIAAWYRHLQQTDPETRDALTADLRQALACFRHFRLQMVDEKVRLLFADFEASGDEPTGYGLSELSDGQRCLVCLYVILHFLVKSGKTVILDEPDNFVSLREIQPWLTAVDDVIAEGRGQVFIISHHPEIINQWAAKNGVRFVREGVGPTRIIPLESGRYPNLLPSEIMARGWEDE